jgi:hypothetical protein
MPEVNAIWRVIPETVCGSPGWIFAVGETIATVDGRMNRRRAQAQPVHNLQTVVM